MKVARLVPRADRLLELRPTCAAGLLVKLIAWVIAAIVTTKQVGLQGRSVMKSKLDVCVARQINLSGD